MSYTKLTNFAAKDALLSGNPSKLLRGTEIGAEFDAIESAMAAAEAVNITAPIIAASTSKTAPVNADVLPILDSAAANILKKVTWANIKATLKTYFDTLYAASGANADITSLSALTNGIVGTAGNQTIAGVKTFSSSPIAPTPASNDISTFVATTAFVRSVGPSYSGIIGFSANATLTSINYGNFVHVDGTFTLTLPVADAANIGRTITCYGYTAASVTVATQSSQLLYYQGTNTATSAVMIGVGDTVTFVNYSGTAWMAMGANALGIGQTWQNVTGSRTSGTTYYNTTGKPIVAACVIIGGAASASSAVGYVNGLMVAHNYSIAPNAGFGSGASVNIVVPPSSSYRLDLAGGGTNTWLELR